MKLTGRRELPVPPQQAWDGLQKPAVLQACLPGCETFDLTNENTYSAAIILVVGPLKAVFKGSVTLTDLEPPIRYRITGQGTSGVAGFAKLSTSVQLSRSETGSVLDYDADVQIGGKLAAVGNRLFESASRKNIDSFFDTFVAHVRSADREPV